MLQPETQSADLLQLNLDTVAGLEILGIEMTLNLTEEQLIFVQSELRRATEMIQNGNVINSIPIVDQLVKQGLLVFTLAKDSNNEKAIEQDYEDETDVEPSPNEK